MPVFYRLKGQVKHYAWGGCDFIPRLMGELQSSPLPCAEYWLGIHPQAPSLLETQASVQVPLSELEPNLSYLLKVLDVKEMLSIQVHPTREMAQADFERENLLGIPLEAPTRNYKDPNHKPELMVALSEFWLLHGFRTMDSFHDLLTKNEFLRPLEIKWKELGCAGLYRWLMEMPQEKVNEMLRGALNEISVLYGSGLLKKSEPAFWAGRVVDHSSADGDIDRGIFSIFLFNLVKLKPGQGIFQGAGVPHAYLEGCNVEIMANSDNVLRGGLTSKHIDVPELLRHVRAESIIPQILSPEPDVEGISHYPVPVDDFNLQSIQFREGQLIRFQAGSACMLLLPEGEMEIGSGDEFDRMGVGQVSFYLEGGSSVELRGIKPGLLFIASSNR